MPEGSCIRGRKAVRSSRGRWPGFDRSRVSLLNPAVHSRPRFFDDVPDDGLEISRLAEDRELPIGARPFSQHRVDVLDLFPAAQIVDDIVQELEEFECERPHRDFDSLSKVDELAVDAPPRRPPFVLFNQRSPIQPESEVVRVEAMQLDDNRLAEGRKHYRDVGLGGNVADPELQRAEGRVRAYVPPDLLSIVDAPEIDQELDVIVVLAPGPEVIRHTRTRESPEDGRAIGLQSGLATHPER